MAQREVSYEEVAALCEKGKRFVTYLPSAIARELRASVRNVRHHHDEWKKLHEKNMEMLIIERNYFQKENMRLSEENARLRNELLEKPKDWRADSGFLDT